MSLLDTLDRLLGRVRYRCPKCGNALVVRNRRIDAAHRCTLCEAASVPAVFISVSKPSRGMSEVGS
jgi:predicted RNA-binding Zn-ribbon protein involved in translation (DUF1610 family)